MKKEKRKKSEKVIFISKEEKGMCSHYYDGCLTGGSGCKPSQEAECGEAKRRRKLLEEPCPVMVSNGYPEKSCQCYIPQIRALVPEKIDCSRDGNCIVLKLVPEARDAIGKHSKEDFEIIKVPFEELLRIKVAINQRLEAVTQPSISQSKSKG